MSQKSSSHYQQMCEIGHTIFKETCRHCRSLKAEWYNYLQASGFEDIEKNGKLKTTKDSHSIRVDFQTTTTFEAKLNYYQWARSKLNDESLFHSTRDKIIWEAHSEGLSTRKIAPLVGIEQSWCVRSIHKIRAYLVEHNQVVSSSNYAANILK